MLANSRAVMMEKIIKENFPFLSDNDFYVRRYERGQDIYVDNELFKVFVNPTFYHLLCGISCETDDYTIQVFSDESLRHEDEVKFISALPIGTSEIHKYDEFDLLLKSMHKHKQG